MISNISSTMSGASPHGRLVHEQDPGAGHQTPGDGQHLLLASRQGAGKLALAFFQAGKATVDVRDVGRNLRHGRPAWPRRRRGGSPRRPCVETPGGSRAPARCPWTPPLAAGSRVRSSPSRTTEPDLGGEDARDGEHGRGLARAVGAEQTRDLAFRRVQADAPQHLDVSVGGDEIPNAQHGFSRSRRQGAAPRWMSRGRPPARPGCAAPRRACRRRSCARS